MFEAMSIGGDASSCTARNMRTSFAACAIEDAQGRTKA